MKVLLIYTHQNKEAWVPIGLLYIAANLRKNNIEVKIIDNHYDNVFNSIIEYDPDIIEMKNDWGSVKIGYSNHSSNWIHPVIASYLGAEMIEVHITLDKNMYGSDQKASLDDSDLTNMMKYRYNPPSSDEINNYMLQEAEVLKKLRQTW